MFEDELKKIWQSSTPAEVIKLDKTKLLVELENELGKFNKAITNRDRREIAVAILLIPLFAGAILYFPALLSKLALGLGLVYCFAVIFILRNVKKWKVNDLSLSLKEFLIKQRDYFMKERSLLDNVLYWYILPPLISTILFFISRDIPNPKLTILISAVIALMGFIYYLNKRSVKNDFDPLIQRLDNAIDGMEE